MASNKRYREDIDQDKYYTPEAKNRKEEMIEELYYYSPKIKYHLNNCPEWDEKTTNIKSENDLPKCEICNKLLCFLHSMMEREMENNSEIDSKFNKHGFKVFYSKINFEKLQKRGYIDYMIFGGGIKIVE